jgi:predicted short-subunit dehydrogenase-like oxidoreductase (DUF2520 family)
MGRPTIAIVGAGNLASAVALALNRAGYSTDAVISRGGASLQRAKLLARRVGSRVVDISKDKFDANIVWFCVPDGAISAAASALASGGNWKGKVALHSSGALTSDELDVLRQRGASVASVHPLMTFVPGSRPSLAGVPFAIEGDAAAVRMAQHIVTDLRARAFPIRKRDKAAYHAWGTFASPLLTALLATTERVAAAAGVNRLAARERMLPILAQTITNYATLGAPGAFSGPLVRGDVDTVKRHLRVLGEVPVARDVYVALAKAALRYLPVKKKDSLKRALEVRSR